jgi:hypothetical protein
VQESSLANLDPIIETTVDFSNLVDPRIPAGKSQGPPEAGLKSLEVARKSSDFTRTGSGRMSRAGSAKMNRAGSGQGRGVGGRQKGAEEASKIDFGKVVQKEERSVGRVELKMYQVLRHFSVLLVCHSTF